MVSMITLCVDCHQIDELYSLAEYIINGKSLCETHMILERDKPFICKCGKK